MMNPDNLPTEPDFRRSTQQLYCPYRKTVRTLERVGVCLTCRRTCFAFTDGENDPRGILGDRAIGDEIEYVSRLTGKPRKRVQCFMCNNEEPRYEQFTRFVEKAARLGCKILTPDWQWVEIRVNAERVQAAARMGGAQ